MSKIAMDSNRARDQLRAAVMRSGSASAGKSGTLYSAGSDRVSFANPRDHRLALVVRSCVPAVVCSGCPDLEQLHQQAVLCTEIGRAGGVNASTLLWCRRADHFA